MTTYVIIDPDDTDSFNRRLFKLSRPDAVRDPRDVTTHYAGVIEHPTDPTAWPLLALPDDETMPVHPQARVEELGAHLDKFQARGAINASEQAAIRNGIAALRGGRVRVLDMLPASWQPYVLTREQAEEAGYFGELE